MVLLSLELKTSSNNSQQFKYKNDRFTRDIVYKQQVYKQLYWGHWKHVYWQRQALLSYEKQY